MNMKKSFVNKSYIVLLAFVLGCGTTFAKDQSIAYIDLDYILRNLPQYEQANEQLSLISRRWQKEVDAAQQEARV